MQKIALHMLITSVLCTGGCALWGGNGTETGSVDKGTEHKPSVEATASGPAATPTPTVSPHVAEVARLWQGVRCSSPREAETKLSAVLASHQGDAEAHALRGLARSELGQKEEAFEDLTEAVRRQPTARNYAWRSLALWRGGNMKGAQVDASYALRKNSKEPVAHMVLGMAALKLDDAGKGCAELKLACDGGECSGLEDAKAGGQCR